MIFLSSTFLHDSYSVVISGMLERKKSKVYFWLLTSLSFSLWSLVQAKTSVSFSTQIFFFQKKKARKFYLSPLVNLAQVPFSSATICRRWWCTRPPRWYSRQAPCYMWVLATTSTSIRWIEPKTKNKFRDSRQPTRYYYWGDCNFFLYSNFPFWFYPFFLLRNYIHLFSERKVVLVSTLSGPSRILKVESKKTLDFILPFFRLLLAFLFSPLLCSICVSIWLVYFG